MAHRASNKMHSQAQTISCQMSARSSVSADARSRHFPDSRCRQASELSEAMIAVGNDEHFGASRSLARLSKSCLLTSHRHLEYRGTRDPNINDHLS